VIYELEKEYNQCLIRTPTCVLTEIVT